MNTPLNTPPRPIEWSNIPYFTDTDFYEERETPTCGMIVHFATVRLYCEKDIAAVIDTWKPGGRRPPSGALNATLDQPAFWTNVIPKDEGHRTLVHLWNCCCDPPSYLWFTDPEDPNHPAHYPYRTKK